MNTKLIFIAVVALASSLSMARLSCVPTTDTVNSLCNHKPQPPHGGHKGCVPEPASMAALAIGGAAMIRRRKAAL